MAFDPRRFSLAVDTIGGQSIRIYFYRSQDAQNLVYGAGYFTDVAKHGVQVNDIIIVADLLNMGVTYNTVVSVVDTHGNATVIDPPDVAAAAQYATQAMGYRDQAQTYSNSASSSASAAATTLGTVGTTVAAGITSINAAAAAALTAGAIYLDTATGLANTTSGSAGHDYFHVPSPLGEEYTILYRNVSGVANEIKRYPSVYGVGLAAAKELFKQVSAAAGSGVVKAAWDYRGPRTPYNSSPTIMTELTSLDATPRILTMYSFIYAGTDAAPRPIFRDNVGIELSSQAGFSYAGTILSKTSGNWAVIYACGLGYITATQDLEANLPAASTLGEGTVYKVNADKNTTFTPDVYDVTNAAYSAAQLVNGIFRVTGGTSTHSWHRGEWVLMSINGASGSYIRIFITHQNQLLAAIYDGGVGSVAVWSLGTFIYGVDKLTIAFRRHDGMLSIIVNGQECGGQSTTAQANIADLATMLINGSARTPNTILPLQSASIPQAFKGLYILDDLPELNFVQVYNRIAEEYGTPLHFRSPVVYAHAGYGQSHTQGSTATANDFLSPTASGNDWYGEVGKETTNSSSEVRATTELIPRVFACLTTDSPTVTELSKNIAILGYNTEGFGAQVNSHAPNSSGENFMFGMIKKLVTHPTMNKFDHFLFGLGLGGASIALLSAKSMPLLPSQLGKAPIAATDVYYQMMRQLKSGVDFFAKRGQRLIVQNMFWDQGHTDTADLTYFSTDMPNFRTMFNADVKFLTGQAFNPKWRMRQVNYASDGIRSRSNVGICLDQGYVDYAIARQAVGDDVAVSHAEYPITYHIHKPRIEHRRAGELSGLAAYQDLDGETTLSMYLDSIRYTAGATQIYCDWKGLLANRYISFVDTNENNIAARRTTEGIDTYGLEFYKKILGGPQYGTLPQNTVSIAANGVVTCVAHGFVGNEEVQLANMSVPPVLPTGYANHTKYYVILLSSSTFGLSATPGGAQIATSGVPASGPTSIYETSNKMTAVTIPSTTGASIVSIANPAVISWTAHGLKIGAKVRFTATTGALPTGTVLNTDYWISASGFSANAFRLQPAPNNPSSIITSGTQSGNHTLTAAEQVTIDIASALGTGSSGTVIGAVKYLGEFNAYGNICDGPKVDGLSTGMDWAGATWASNKPTYKVGALNDVRRWALAATKIITVP